MALRIHLDEHVHSAIARGLRSRGIDVTTTIDARLVAADDLQQLSYALAERRVFFTQDEDFLTIASQGIEHAGIVYVRPTTRSIRQIIEVLALIAEYCDEDDMRNKVEFG